MAPSLLGLRKTGFLATISIEGRFRSGDDNEGPETSYLFGVVLPGTYRPEPLQNGVYREACSKIEDGPFSMDIIL